MSAKELIARKVAEERARPVGQGSRNSQRKFKMTDKQRGMVVGQYGVNPYSAYSKTFESPRKGVQICQRRH